MKNKKFFLVALILSPALLLSSRFRYNVFGSTIFDNKGKMHVFRGRLACAIDLNDSPDSKVICSGFGYTPIAGDKLEIIFYENQTCMTYSTYLRRWKTPLNQSPICKATYKSMEKYEQIRNYAQNPKYAGRHFTFTRGNCKKSWTSNLLKTEDILLCHKKGRLL